MRCWTTRVFFPPSTPFFGPRLGGPSTPMEVYLRLMFLKFRCRLGYETLCREVAGWITWRRLWGGGGGGHVPHPTTLMKLTTRCGTAAVEGCNEALLAKAAQAKLLRTTRLRADTTSSPPTWPTRPTPGCWLRRCAGSPRPDVGSRPPAAPPAPGCGTAAGLRVRGPGRSARSCDCAPRGAATRPKPRFGG